MKLRQILIRKFRSIDYLDLNLNNNLNIFVGKNESGKSNIIKAISHLSPDVVLDKQNIRETLPDEEIAKLSAIFFAFAFSDDELIKIYDIIKELFYNINLDDKFIKYKNTKITLKDFCLSRKSLLYVCSITGNSRYYSDYPFDDTDQEVLKNIVQITSKSSIETVNRYVELEDFEMENREKIKLSDINQLIVEQKTIIASKETPEVLHWSYSEENLLPSTINIVDFAQNPEICKPLKNMFHLAGIEDVQDSILKIRQVPVNRYRNYLDRIANHATKHFVDIWKEYDNVSFSIEPNGNDIEINIKEKNKYTLEQRSDGFKRFITFLLMISISVKNETIKNSLILLDEPDVSLHPSGIRYLRKELKKISLNNLVVVATHSIFMIDGKNINDYHIVKKESEKTTIEKPTEKNIAAEEVLFRALDFSVYELIKDFNILFEGWRDKKLFQVACSALSDGLNDFYGEIGISHTSGVKNVKNITPVFELIGKKCLVVSDSDKTAKERQREFKKDHFYGSWMRYDEIDNNTSAITGEDFLQESFVLEGIGYINSLHPILKGIPNFSTKKGTILNVENWMKEQNVSNVDIPTYIDEFKTFLFDKLEQKHISQTYYDFLVKLQTYIDSIRS